MGHRVRIVSAVVLLLAGVSVLGAPAGAQDPGTCNQPYPPVWGSTPGLPDIDAAEVPVQAAGVRYDLDDSGAARIVQGPVSAEVVVERPSGELRITASSDILAYSAGDLDGDGNDEIWVSTAGGTTERSWIVPFATADGTVDVTVAGIEVPFGVPYLVLAAATGENPVTTSVQGAPSGPGNGTTRVLDGAAILAVGAGGDATSVPAVAEYDDQAPAAVVEFADGPALVLTRLRLDSSATEYTSIDPGGATIRFTTIGSPRNDGNRSAPTPALGAMQGGSGRFLRLTSFGFAPTQYEYLWSYDDPCTSLEVASTPTTAASAPAGAPLSLTG